MTSMDGVLPYSLLDKTKFTLQKILIDIIAAVFIMGKCEGEIMRR